MELHIKKQQTANPGESPRGMFASRKSLTLWTIIAVVVISVAAYLLVVAPQWGRVGLGKELDTATLESTYKERERVLSQVKELRDNYEKIDQEQISLLSNILPTDKSVPELLNQLEAIARQSGVSLIDISISEVVDKGISAKQALQQEVGKTSVAVKSKEIKKMNVQLQVSTDKYPAFKQFIEQVQSHTRLLDIESYLFSTEQELQNLTIKAYYIVL